MPSFDITSDVDWQEIDNGIHQAEKEIGSRFDFKSVKVELKMDRKLKEVQIWCSEEAKLEAVMDVLQTKWIKRQISLLAFDTKEAESAHGGSVRQKVLVKAGIEKDKGKEIIHALKDSKLKVSAQILDEQVRVTAKNRDELQLAIQHLKGQQEKIKLPMQFGNFRE